MILLVIRFLPLIFLIAINIASFAVFGIDKRRAELGKWRIKERTMILMAVIGGSVGAIGGMHTFHHKTRKWYFRIGIPAILIIELAAAALFIAWDMGLFG